jgi:hypothetical protein
MLALQLRIFVASTLTCDSLSLWLLWQLILHTSLHMAFVQPLLLLSL